MIIGSMIIKNESDRYLQASLTRLNKVCDKVFVADDGSDDDSLEIVSELGCHVWHRPDDVPSFQDHEGKFRQAAWDAMAVQLKLKETDWVLSIDADEYFTGNKTQLKRLVSDAGSRECFSFLFREVWSISPLEVRTDGFWNTNFNRRFRRFDSARFRDVKMGCGSVPQCKYATEVHKIPILHFGYAVQDDRIKKSEFYNSIAHGHNDNHIQSILKKPNLERLEIEVDFWRGRK